MGIRLAFNKPTGKQRSPAQTEGHQVPSGDEKRSEGMSAGPQFDLLGLSAEDRKRRWLVLGFSPIFEAVAAGIMIWALMSLPPKPPLVASKEEVVYFHPAAPPPEPVKQEPRTLKQPAQRPSVAPAPRLPRLKQQEIQRPQVVEHLKVPRVSQSAIEFPKAPPKPAEHFVAVRVHGQTPKQQITPVRTGKFNPGNMAKATVKRPLREVQTGGFGADNGIPNNPSAKSQMRVAQLGSFDLPSGPGHGNGTGGSKGVRGTVARAGFGNGIGEATGSRSNSDVSQKVHQGTFGSVVAGGKTTRTHSAAQNATFKSVIILSKPHPVYPAEARRQHIEGQVILSVLFGASGNLRVLKVVQGLGHGMDEAAIQAAEHITFKPAERDGQPVDSKAIVHIIFQLAY